MQIKKLLILASILLTAVCSSYAQSPQPQIEGFWGVKLGESENTVVRTVRQSYPSANYAKDTTGHPFTVGSCKLAGLDVTNCQFTFTNGIFTQAKFNKSAGWKQIHVSRVQTFLNSISQNMQSDYQEFCEAISEKYGTPRVAGQTVTWRTSNGNSITIKPWVKEDSGIVFDDGTTFAGMGFYIIYSKGSHLNDF